MISVKGYSDDLIEYGAKEVDCFEKDVRIRFSDGTVIRCGYGKGNLGIWWIEIEKYGTAKFKLVTCDDEEAEIYSDQFEIEAEVAGVSIVKEKYPGGRR